MSFEPSLLAPTSTGSVDISVKGKWSSVPSLKVGQYALVIKGKWLKVATIHAEEWSSVPVDAPEVLLGALRKTSSSRFRADIFTFAQKVSLAVPMYNYPFEWESIAAIRIVNFGEWWDKLPQESRKNVRKAKKRGVVVTVKVLDDDLVTEIIGVNNDSPIRQGIPFVHYGKTFDQVKRDQSSYSDRSEFLCAHCEGDLLGFAKIVYSGKVASILQFVPKATQHDKRPGNALIAAAVELCAARGVSHLVYGKFNYGNKQNSPLREFKRRNGFEEILVPRYYVPLTTWGALCIRMKLHKGLLGVLPHSVISFCVGARAMWYSWVKLSSRRSSRVRAAEK